MRSIAVRGLVVDSNGASCIVRLDGVACCGSTSRLAQWKRKEVRVECRVMFVVSTHARICELLFFCFRRKDKDHDDWGCTAVARIETSNCATYQITYDSPFRSYYPPGGAVLVLARAFM